MTDPSQKNLTEIVNSRLCVTENNTSECSKLEPCVKYYIIKKKIIIKFYNDLSHSLINDVRIISKQISRCDEIIMDMTKSSCHSMSGLGLLTYLLMGSQDDANKSFFVITDDEKMKEIFFKYLKNVKIVSSKK